MANNIGGVDRAVRFGVGAVLAGLGLAVFAGTVDLTSVVGGLALGLGVVLVGTALRRTCLLYRFVGVDTCRSR
ncbi:YgaP family membrane protein [Halosimplex amylolyticum]|uniref:YgaP family membrane protein n=1 Tax=Halosimplex amylolyticum TaxID=3396616 RepID=UPI003F56E75A